MNTITTINGNGQAITRPLPKLHIITQHINDVALSHCYHNSGLKFVPDCNGYSAQPTDAIQITQLLLTWNLKTQYHDNLTNKNTLFLKFANCAGFKVDSICLDCCQHNHVYTGDMKAGSRLAV